MGKESVTKCIGVLLNLWIKEGWLRISGGLLSALARSGASGTIGCRYYTEDMGAVAGMDYKEAQLLQKGFPFVPFSEDETGFQASEDLKVLPIFQKRNKFLILVTLF